MKSAKCMPDYIMCIEMYANKLIIMQRCDDLYFEEFFYRNFKAMISLLKKNTSFILSTKIKLEYIDII